MFVTGAFRPLLARSVCCQVSVTRRGSFPPQVQRPVCEPGAQAPPYMKPMGTNGDCWPGSSTHAYHVLATGSVCQTDAAHVAWCSQFGSITPGPGTYNLAESGPRRPGAGLTVNIGGVDVVFGGTQGTSSFVSKAPRPLQRVRWSGRALGLASGEGMGRAHSSFVRPAHGSAWL